MKLLFTGQIKLLHGDWYPRLDEKDDRPKN